MCSASSCGEGEGKKCSELSLFFELDGSVAAKGLPVHAGLAEKGVRNRLALPAAAIEAAHRSVV